MDVVNRFFIEDGYLDLTKNFKDENNNKEEVIYEVIRINNGSPLFLKEHLKRMEKSFKIMGKTFSYEYKKINEYLERVICANDKKDGNIKITFNINEDVMKVFYIKHSYPTEAMYKNGVDAILYHGERHNPNAKVVDGDFRNKVNKEMKKVDAFEAILVDNNGYITEGSKSNIFLIKDNKLLTSNTEVALPGVTRGKIIEIAKKEYMKFEEVEFKYTKLQEIDAMFISGTSPGILPISKVNNISMNVNNELMKRIMNIYNNELMKKS